MSETNLTRRGFIGHVGGAYTAIAIGSSATIAVAADPLLNLIAEYRAAITVAEAMDGSSPGWPGAEARMVKAQTELWRRPPETTSMKGATEAVRVVLNTGDLENCDEAVLRRVLEFLEMQVA